MKVEFFSTVFFRNAQISNFNKNRPVKAELFHADGRKDRQTCTTRPVVAFPYMAYAPKNVIFFHCHPCKSQFANFYSLCRHSRGEFLNKVTNNWQPISSPGKILRSVSFNFGNGTKSVFYCETDSLIDMPNLSRHSTKMENSRPWTVQIASSFTDIRRGVSESHLENLIFAILEAVTVAVGESARFQRWHHFGY